MTWMYVMERLIWLIAGVGIGWIGHVFWCSFQQVKDEVHEVHELLEHKEQDEQPNGS